jgi:hypothetical protein
MSVSLDVEPLAAIPKSAVTAPPTVVVRSEKRVTISSALKGSRSTVYTAVAGRCDQRPFDSNDAGVAVTGRIDAPAAHRLAGHRVIEGNAGADGIGEVVENASHVVVLSNVV